MWRAFIGAKPKPQPITPRKQETKKKEDQFPLIQVKQEDEDEEVIEIVPKERFKIVQIPKWIPPSTIKEEEDEKLTQIEEEELKPPLRAEIDLPKIEMKYLIGWQHSVFEFGIMLAAEDEDDFGSVMDLRRWYQGPRPSEKLEEWSLSCFKNRFAIERSWEYLYEMQPTVYVSAFHVMCAQGNETRQRFAEMVRETSSLAQVMRSTISQTKATYVLVAKLLDKREIVLQWFRSRTNTHDVLSMYTYQLCSIRMFELLNECDIEDFNRIDETEYEKETTEEWIYRSTNEWLGSNDNRLATKVYERRQKQSKDSVRDAIETIRPWIDLTFNASQQTQVLVLVVVLVVSIITKQDLLSIGRKQIVWLYSLLKIDIEHSTHILKTTASLCEQRRKRKF